ncbi:hypothetical protein ONS95_008588 [Cadophora gregata]|uniref:uncharacterized protein n=1 Tax=Cadophora gregata TaxID=51156 RepID=UPI0026DB37F6|nr:uncharacterized protein ONS95_008588 [Cadophora gregata]KAK0099837.1 hypothetical protein ONS95_008588 [Cadophora gregata]KAK0123602.1 hypothetical protein ONS96_010577 [Cadophora gregata f. sp. sojae]
MVGVISDERRYLVIYDPNHIVPTPNEKHKSGLLSGQKLFIQHCLAHWSSLSTSRLYVVGHGTGNNDGVCLQHCSRWIQHLLGNENWRKFPWTEIELLSNQHGTPILWERHIPRGNSRNTPRNTPSTPRLSTRSSSRSASPAPGRSTSPISRSSSPHGGSSSRGRQRGLRQQVSINLLTGNGEGPSGFTGNTPVPRTPTPDPGPAAPTPDGEFMPDWQLRRSGPTPEFGGSTEPSRPITPEAEYAAERPPAYLPWAQKSNCRAPKPGEPSTLWDRNRQRTPEGFRHLFSSLGGNQDYFDSPDGVSTPTARFLVWDNHMPPPAPVVQENIYDISRHTEDAPWDLIDNDDDVDEDLLATYQLAHEQQTYDALPQMA